MYIGVHLYVNCSLRSRWEVRGHYIVSVFAKSLISVQPIKAKAEKRPANHISDQSTALLPFSTLATYAPDGDQETELMAELWTQDKSKISITAQMQWVTVGYIASSMKKLSTHARFCIKDDLTVCNNKYFAGSIIGQDIENNVMISLACSCSIHYRLHSKHRLFFI